jgi:hypothetical protein
VSQNVGNSQSNQRVDQHTYDAHEAVPSSREERYTASQVAVDLFSLKLIALGTGVAATPTTVGGSQPVGLQLELAALQLRKTARSGQLGRRGVFVS